MGSLPLKGFGFVLILVTFGAILQLSVSIYAPTGIATAENASTSNGKGEGETPSVPLTDALLSEPILALHTPADLDQEKVQFGEILFNDTLLSRDGSIACVSCHNLGTGGTDQLTTSRGIGGAIVARNAPTVFNVGLNFSQFWDGRARTLEDQIDGPMLNPSEMGGTWSEILDKLKRDPFYADAFERLYDDGIQVANVKDAIATFERSLVTTGARFDKFLLGNANAITDQEKAGYALFKSFGCIACHQGRNIGGNMFQKLGIFEDYFDDGPRNDPNNDPGNASDNQAEGPKLDYGRFNITGREQDRYVFKVPSLRNVTLTAPYFHDGSVEKLDHAVALMAKYQLGRDLSVLEIEQIVAFLGSLTGEFRGEPLWR